MATNKYIRGLTRAGFRVPKVGGGFGHVTMSGTTQVDLDDHKTQLILQGERNLGSFTRVASSGSTTATIVGLSRRGFRITNSGGSKVVVKVGSGVHTIDLTKGNAVRSLLRNKRDWLFSASATQVAVRGTQNEQNGFYLKTAGTDSITSNNTNVSNADAVTIGSKTYTFKTNLTEAKATATLTSDATAPADGATVTVNNKTYTFKTALTPTAGEVLIGGSASVALDNLKSAVNGTAGSGTTYAAGTTQPTGVTATTKTATTLLFVASAIGTAANSFASTETSTHLSFGGTTFAGGVNAVANEIHIGGSADASLTNLSEAINAGSGVGTDYSTGTTANADATASAVAAHAITLTAVGGGSLTITVSTTASTLTVSQATLNDSLVKVYRGVAVTVDATNPFNFQQLRRHYMSWISG